MSLPPMFVTESVLGSWLLFDAGQHVVSVSAFTDPEMMPQGHYCNNLITGSGSTALIWDRSHQALTSVRLPGFVRQFLGRV